VGGILLAILILGAIGSCTDKKETAESTKETAAVESSQEFTASSPYDSTRYPGMGKGAIVTSLEICVQRYLYE